MTQKLCDDDNICFCEKLKKLATDLWHQPWTPCRSQVTTALLKQSIYHLSIHLTSIHFSASFIMVSTKSGQKQQALFTDVF